MLLCTADEELEIAKKKKAVHRIVQRAIEDHGWAHIRQFTYYFLLKIWLPDLCLLFSFQLLVLRYGRTRCGVGKKDSILQPFSRTYIGRQHLSCIPTHL